MAHYKKEFTKLLHNKHKHIDDITLLYFNIIMDIHMTHEQIKRGILSKESSLLRDYYRYNSEYESTTMKEDTLFYNKDGIPMVYSVYLDSVFPLIEYPFHLYEDATKVTIQKPENNKLIEFYKNLKYDENDEKFSYVHLFLKKIC